MLLELVCVLQVFVHTCVCRCICTCVCVCGGQRLTLYVCLGCSPVKFWRLGLTKFRWVDCLVSPKDLSVSTSPTLCWNCRCVPLCPAAAAVLDSYPHAWPASTFLPHFQTYLYCVLRSELPRLRVEGGVLSFA